MRKILWGREFKVVPMGLSEEDVSEFLGELLDRQKETNERLRHIDSLHELARRTLLDAQEFADQVKSTKESNGFTPAQFDRVSWPQVKTSENGVNRADSLHELARRTVLEAQGLAEEVTKSQKIEADAYAKMVASKAESDALETVVAAEKHASNLYEVADKKVWKVLLCAFGRHTWGHDSAGRICQRCGQLEVVHQNIYGDAPWAVRSRKIGTQLIRLKTFSVLSFAVAALMSTFVLSQILGYGSSQVERPYSLEFADMEWRIKSNLVERIGPGPNYFSEKNVLIDDDGRIHLSIENVSGKWSTSEMIAKKSLGYGTYTVTLAQVPQQWSDGVVFGFFTWDESPSQFHREIDIEFRNAEIDGQRTPGTFAVQPWEEPGNIEFLNYPPTGGVSYSFTWTPGSIEFFVTGAGGNIEQSWVYAGPFVPSPGNEKLRINLWLVNGRPPSNAQPVEVILDSVTFQPYRQPSVHEAENSSQG